MKKPFSFSKEERLHSKKIIKELFDKGSSFFLYPYKVAYLIRNPAEPQNQVLVSVSSKKFPKAVVRNKIKRLTREAYRLNKSIFPFPNPNISLIIGFVYLGKEQYPFSFVQNKLIKALNRLVKEVPTEINHDQK
jgi:ribonuclease P protein component